MFVCKIPQKFEEGRWEITATSCVITKQSAILVYFAAEACKHSKIRPVEQPSCSMRTYRRTDMMKLTVAFRNFANAPKTFHRATLPIQTYLNAIYEGNSVSKLQIQVATYVFELSAGNCHR